MRELPAGEALQRKRPVHRTGLFANGCGGEERRAKRASRSSGPARATNAAS